MKAVSTEKLVISKEVRTLCEQNSCGYYGTNWTCPPAVAPLETLKNRFASFNTILIVYLIHHVKSSFDWKGMMCGAAEFKSRLQTLHGKIKETDPLFPFLLLGMGSCDLCKTCTYTLGKPCIHPDDAIISLEACGVDVMRLMKDHDMKYYNGKNTVTYIAGLLYNNV